MLRKELEAELIVASAASDRLCKRNRSFCNTSNGNAVTYLASPPASGAATQAPHRGNSPLQPIRAPYPSLIQKPTHFARCAASRAMFELWCLFWRQQKKRRCNPANIPRKPILALSRPINTKASINGSIESIYIVIFSTKL